jgi:hypothetical protein
MESTRIYRIVRGVGLRCLRRHRPYRTITAVTDSGLDDNLEKNRRGHHDQLRGAQLGISPRSSRSFLIFPGRCPRLGTTARLWR